MKKLRMKFLNNNTRRKTYKPGVMILKMDPTCELEKEIYTIRDIIFNNVADFMNLINKKLAEKYPDVK